MKNLLAAAIFSGFPSWKSMAFTGEVTPKILKFEITLEEKNTRPLYLAAIISKEEKMAWQSFQDVLERTATLAQSHMRGFFGFNVLSVDIQTGIRNFNPNDLSRLIVNHSRVLGPVPIPINRSAAEIGAVPTAINEKKIKVGADQKALIRYGQLFALLHYRAPADWGKIEVKTHVEFFSQAAASAEVTEASVLAALKGSGSKNKNSPGDQSQSFFNNCSEAEIGAVPAAINKKKEKPGQLDLLLKKLLKKGGREPGAVYILHDLSLKPIWDPSNEVQQQRMRAWLEKEKQAHTGILPEIYYGHAAKCVSLRV